MRRDSWKLWGAAALSACLLELPFPLAGPLPVGRSCFAWFALVPLLSAVLSAQVKNSSRPLRRGFLLAYFCGVLWYIGNCYWVRDTMSRYGDMPPLAPSLLLLTFSLILGLYFGVFGLGLALVHRASGSTRLALAASPILWTALELAAARITCVPWDQLGYSQVDNVLLYQLAPFTGVYGISFVVAAVNALLVGGLLLERRKDRLRWASAGTFLFVGGSAALFISPSRPAPTNTAVLIQPNLDVAGNNDWAGPGEWEAHIAQFAKLAGQHCNATYIAGIPETGAPKAEIACPPYPTHPDLVVWPESPAPFLEADPRFQQALASLATTVQAPLVVGSIGMDYSVEERGWRDYNSALIIGADGRRLGRYDKIHLVPFGEYIPFERFLSFAHKLTGRVSKFSRGDESKVFLLGGRKYGVLICYESVFADEVRQFPRSGAEVLVNISDDGWYGNTSAPWQHLNMARMRAIENDRWILLDTNNGITAVIDPNGRVRQSIARNQIGALPAQYGVRHDVTFYAAHGDLFAWGSVVLALGITAWALLLEFGFGRPTKEATKQEYALKS